MGLAYNFRREPEFGLVRVQARVKQRLDSGRTRAGQWSDKGQSEVRNELHRGQERELELELSREVEKSDSCLEKVT